MRRKRALYAFKLGLSSVCLLYLVKVPYIYGSNAFLSTNSLQHQKYLLAIVKCKNNAFDLCFNFLWLLTASDTCIGEKILHLYTFQNYDYINLFRLAPYFHSQFITRKTFSIQVYSKYMWTTLQSLFNRDCRFMKHSM